MVGAGALLRWTRTLAALVPSWVVALAVVLPGSWLCAALRRARDGWAGWHEVSTAVRGPVAMVASWIAPCCSGGVQVARRGVRPSWWGALGDSVSGAGARVLQLDERALQLRVEPRVTAAQAARYLAPRGYALAVCPPLGDRTLGDLAVYDGASSQSHAAGLFRDTVCSCEPVAGDCRVVSGPPSPLRPPGPLVSLSVRVVRAPPRVLVRYTPVRGRGTCCALLRRLADGGGGGGRPDFVEAILFGGERAVLVTGVAAACGARGTGSLRRRCQPWFYERAEAALRTGSREEVMPLVEYLLRHERALFWTAPHLLPRAARALLGPALGWMFPPKLWLWRLAAAAAAMGPAPAFRDYAVPLRHLERCVDIAAELFPERPLLVYPCRGREDLFGVVGVYGAAGGSGVARLAMERHVREAGGFSLPLEDRNGDGGEGGDSAAALSER